MTHHRPGWERKTISLSVVGGNLAVDALCYGDIGVHRMVRASGWCFSYVPHGLRMSSGYRVFASAEAAMDVVEKIYPLSNDWSVFFHDELGEHLREKFNAIHDAADARGAFLDTLVAPTRYAV